MVDLQFPNGWDERIEFEAEARGYYDNVVVKLDNGGSYKLCFYDPVRIAQDLGRSQEFGEVCIAEPGLVVVPTVNLQSIKDAVSQLHERGYFKSILPLK